MNYELAKQLKEAGFEFIWRETAGEYHSFYYTNKDVPSSYVHQDFVPKDAIPCPTLSELIEACGDQFGRLDAPWAGNPRWCAMMGKGTSQKFYTKGNSPEEAVAQLWLAIHEEKENQEKKED